MSDQAKPSPHIKVSILMITYNQEQYVAQAINSILMQQVNFGYEIVIGEDCSQDRTRDIVTVLQDNYPDKIRLLLHQTNLGVNKNFILTFQACQGEYIAILEGDDYWISPLKLQKQVDFLDSHPDYVACFHNVVKLYEHDGVQKPWSIPRSETGEVYTLKSLLRKNFIPTCSIMFRNNLFEKFPDWFETVPLPDWALHTLNAQYGTIGYIDEVLAVYRVHRGGVWASKQSIDSLTSTIQAAEYIRQNLNVGHQQQIDVSIMGWYLRSVHLLLDRKDFREASFYARKGLYRFKFHQDFSNKNLVKFVLAGFFPWVYYWLWTTAKKITSDLI